MAARQQLLDKVMARLDEVSEFSSGLTIVNHQVAKEMDDSAVELMHLLPAYMAYPENGTPEFSGGYITCPEDFVKIARLKLSSWDIPVTACTYPGDPRESFQLYPYLASDGRNPLAVIYNGAAGEITIKVYPNGGTLTEFNYVKRPSAAEQINENLVDMFTWLCASRVYRVHGEKEAANICEEKLASIIQVKMAK